MVGTHGQAPASSASVLFTLSKQGSRRELPLAWVQRVSYDTTRVGWRGSQHTATEPTHVLCSPPSLAGHLRKTARGG